MTDYSNETQVKPMIYDFAVQTVRLCRKVQNTEHEKNMTNQLIRSSTSINANYAEAKFAASRADFANKLNIALKEANESAEWLSLLKDTKYITEDEFKPLYNLVQRIIRILTSSVKTLKSSPSNP